MPVSRLESLHDALASLNNWSSPDSDAYQLRNPLLLRSFARPGKNEIDTKGRRVFGSSLAGIRAGVYDLDLKIRGESRAGLKKNDKLENLLRVFGINEKLGMTQVVRFLKRALKDEGISVATPLSYFIAQPQNKWSTK